MIIEWSLNGRPLRVDVLPFHRLANYLRNEMKLLGTKIGCTEGNCGVCTVWINGAVANACLVLMGQLQNKEVTTIEGINEKDRFTPLQENLLSCSAFECGFCVPGIVMSGSALLEREPNPSRLQIREALKGHLCACTGYQKILDAIEGIALPPVSEGAARLRRRY